MSDEIDRPASRRQHIAADKKTIDAFWSGTSGAVTIAVVGIAAVFGLLVAFGVL